MPYPVIKFALVQAFRITDILVFELNFIKILIVAAETREWMQATSYLPAF